MSAIKLSDLQQGADEKYPDFEIEVDNEDGKEPKTLAFQPVLRLNKAGRRAVATALDIRKRFAVGEGEDETDDDLTDAISDAFKLTARNVASFNGVKKWAGEDLGRWLFLIEQYQGKTNAGEA
jgi:hypothetical protein